MTFELLADARTELDGAASLLTDVLGAAASPRLSTGMEDWATPQDFFDKCDAEFGFTLDACATAENAKCPKYFTKDDDGLKQSWSGHRVWMNPPYGKDIPKWMEKAYRESKNGAELVACLVPARTDTKWWHDFAEKGEKRFVKGRLKFLSTDGPLRRATKSVLEGRHAPNLGAPFPSVLVVFKAPNATSAPVDRSAGTEGGSRASTP